MATKRIKDITNTGSEDDLKSENFLALDGPNGSKKIPGDAFTPSSRTASISSSIAPEFDPDRAETYPAGSLVMHEGELREFTVDHPTGPWISGDNRAASIEKVVKRLVASKVIAVDYADLTFPIAEGTQCFHDGGYFYANTDIATSEDWTAAHWTETSVAEQTDFDKAVNNNFIELHAKVLDKYKPFVDYENFENEPVLYNKLTQTFLFGRALKVNTSFTPTYSSDDIKGDYDWPLFAYFEVPNSLTTSFFFPFKRTGSTELRVWEISIYDDNVVGIRFGRNDGSIPAGYNFLLGGAVQLRK